MEDIFFSFLIYISSFIFHLLYFIFYISFPNQNKNLLKSLYLFRNKELNRSEILSFFLLLDLVSQQNENTG